jgi:sec-independent protein translocase protein TatB
LVVAVFVIGPDRMPESAAKLAKLIEQLGALADTAKVQLREQMGPDFGDVGWKQYDPRQYDPRRIVREALLDSGSDGGEPGDGQPGGFKAPSSFKRHDPDQPTPDEQEARDSPIRWVPPLALLPWRVVRKPVAVRKLVAVADLLRPENRMISPERCPPPTSRGPGGTRPGSTGG